MWMKNLIDWQSVLLDCQISAWKLKVKFEQQETCWQEWLAG
jgi:hypothetical protein